MSERKVLEKNSEYFFPVFRRISTRGFMTGFMDVLTHSSKPHLLVTTWKRSLGEGNVFAHVCHSVHGALGGLCMISLPVRLPGPMFLLGVSVSGPMFLPGVHLSRGGLCPGGGLSVRETPVQWRAGGMHPTGMHSCMWVFLHLPWTK